MSATGKADLERDIVGHAEGSDLGLAGLEHLLRLLEDRALDAAVGNGAGHLARPGDPHLRTQGPRAGSPCLDHRRERDVLALARPLLQLAQDLTHCLYQLLRAARVPRPASSLPRSSRACRLLAARKSSQCGSAAAIPLVKG